MLLATEILDRLSEAFGPLRVVPDQDPRAPAVKYEYADGMGQVGMIASISRPFCMSCNRVRLTSDGKLRNCLFALEETDIRGMLRRGVADQQIARAVRQAVASKWEGHEINTTRFIQPERLMHSIGG